MKNLNSHKTHFSVLSKRWVLAKASIGENREHDSSLIALGQFFANVENGEIVFIVWELLMHESDSFKEGEGV